MNIQGGYMNLEEVFQGLTEFSNIVKDELSKIKNIQFQYDDSNKNEQFLYSHYMEIISDMGYTIEDIEYINRPVLLSGIVTLQGNKLYLNDLELKSGDTIESLIEDEWQKVEIYKVKGEFYGPLLKGTLNNYGRIRLTEEEAKNRLLQK